MTGAATPLAFAGIDEWDAWLGDHGGRVTEAWLIVAKKGRAGLTAAQAGDVALCHGWIDSHRRARDEGSFLQRYSPRRPGSPWSRVNVDRASALAAAGRMRPAGEAQIAAARADGRWAAAYAPQRAASAPPDLLAALAAEPAAASAFAALGRSGQYSLFLPLLKARTPAARSTALRRALSALHAGA
ncbi:YdeI/OmpD-associated family protein [Dactylosporangium sp. CA-139066]|uniref:YdeI/OmpD-associated family protein n=1 Tax=Dactylosporangium sp. CA-139066 TaxID=3239930 RepID=UPI003D8CE9A2